MSAGNLYIGTSGWNYKHWRNGVFYPPKLASEKWLAYFSERFNTVEINSTFYRLPKRENCEKWSATVPGNFRFAVKMWRAITHYQRLVDTVEQLREFLEVVEPLRTPESPLLIQLPPGLKLDLELLRAFLGDLNHAMDVRPWPIAFEFRNKSWLTSAVREVLEEANASLVVQDMKYCVNAEPNRTALVYVRRHGPGNWGRYTAEQLQAEAEQIRAWRAQGRPVYVYFNNDAQGFAIENARELSAITL